MKIYAPETDYSMVVLYSRCVILHSVQMMTIHLLVVGHVKISTRKLLKVS